MVGVATAPNEGASSGNQNLKKPSSVHFREETDEILPATPEATDDQSDEIEKVAASLQAANLQQPGQNTSRLHFDYQPFSQPASQVPSRESHEQRIPNSPSLSKAMNTPPLTPANTQDRTRLTRSHERPASVASPTKLHPYDPAIMTPQTSPPRTRTGTSTPRSQEEMDGAGASRPQSALSEGKHAAPTFQIGPSSSQEDSPDRTPGSSGATTPTWNPPSRPFTPAGEIDDPYARSKRPPQSKKPNEIEDRFKFGRSKNHHSSQNLSVKGDTKPDKRHSSALSLHGLGRHLEDEGGSMKSAKRGSMIELKRFFKGNSKKRTQSPSASSVHSMRSNSGASSQPFADDHGLSKKYGKFGRVLGSGAGGSVRLMKRSSDGVTFAVKEFRPRHTYETEREYAKKVTAEFCIGSTLHHGNIIETLDIVQERGKWYEVMEYCPYDLFATVMTGKMSREEVACCFVQLLSGVSYLHGMGLAHRDLKLDNVCINEHGILKIIDFGSASVFRYPFENDIVEAHGIVGSDPYLAPEVCNELKYDPQPADIWSLAIVFCCMTLRRFPWKAPRQSDNSFRLFTSPPDADQSTAGTSSNPAPSQVTGSGQPANQIKGPMRLLRLLPREARTIMSRMLDLDPKKRATLDEVWNDPWIRGIEHCSQEAGSGKVQKAQGHTHTLEGQPNTSGAAVAQSRQSAKKVVEKPT